MSATPATSAVEERSGDAALVERLRAGDEESFLALVERHEPVMLRVAAHYVDSRATAEEVVQETWPAVLEGIGRFEGRSSLKTWLFRILANLAITRAKQDGRSVSFSALGCDDDGPAVDPEPFLGPDSRWEGHWAVSPRSWAALPADRLLARETVSEVAAAIDTLPPLQQQVLALRDVEGWAADEVCAALRISDANQRVLLHRGRSKVRARLEAYLDG
jgi:RNA polymerase sigma-70 factor (ECF subfamily)